MVDPDWGTRFIVGIMLDETQIPWVSVEPGSTMVGSDKRSILFGGIGPRHEVKIEYPFRISERPVDFEEVARIEQNYIADLRKCIKEWCDIDAGKYDGWIKKTDIWAQRSKIKRPY